MSDAKRPLPSPSPSPPEGRSVVQTTERPDDLSPSRNWREASDTPRQFDILDGGWARKILEHQRTNSTSMPGTPMD